MTEIILSPLKNRRIENGHPWIYDNEVADTKGDMTQGEIVAVYNHKKKFIGKGYANPRSHILVRLLTYQLKEEINKAFFKRKIQEAYSYRQKLGYQDSFRLVFGEADFLPALVIDKFGDYFSLQTLAFGIDQFKKEIVEILEELFNPKGIYERNDVPVRELEGLSQQSGFLGREFPTKTIITENNFKILIDIANGQKTGYFLDQTANRASIAPFVRQATVLDCFSHTGSFAVHAAGYGAKKVTAVDISEVAIATAKENASINNLANIDFVTANAFDLLKEWAKEGRQFDVVILDPPAFTKTRGNIENALRGYKEINLRGMKLVKKGGFLITCSCSHFIKPDIFKRVIFDAAIDAGKIVREILYKPQGNDHPILWNVEETLYLKFYILQIL
ncbi:MAG: class I SAM-dependent rRNA methyltransferase [Thermoflexibacter sp.]|jgi:23S rRNA (cytosine1962-C5)-methyltransferase|nr:class I SAM-dependent rRNA methyltransferase [Thermoflexibacter sp.]